MLKFRASLLSLVLALVVPSAPQAMTRTTTTAVTSQPKIASGNAMIVDLDTDRVIYSNHLDLVCPIVSIIELMTATIVLNARLPLDEELKVGISQASEMKGIYSRMRLNGEISRKDMLLLALISSENRVAVSLAHHYLDDYNVFTKAMNAKAKALGTTQTRSVESTGLSIYDVSTVHDLIELLIVSRQYPLTGQLNTTCEGVVTFANPTYAPSFHNTNHLIYRDNWNIQLTETGFINAAGHYLAMHTMVNNKSATLMVMDTPGRYIHFVDASRLCTRIETSKMMSAPTVVLDHKGQRAAQMAAADSMTSEQTTQND